MNLWYIMPAWQQRVYALQELKRVFQYKRHKRRSSWNIPAQRFSLPFKNETWKITVSFESFDNTGAAEFFSFVRYVVTHITPHVLSKGFAR